ncbi:MAG: hypothetical protein AAF206_20230 [Bacteroidota bacterium]
MKQAPLALDVLKLNRSIRNLKKKFQKENAGYLGDDLEKCVSLLSSATKQAETQEEAFRDLFPYIEQAHIDLETLSPHIYVKPTLMERIYQFFSA